MQKSRHIDLSEDILLTDRESERFWNKVDKSCACWIWIGSSVPTGYGVFKVRSYQMVSAHRLSWYIKNGPIPHDLIICHICDNPKCVNPEHLYAGTYQSNFDDMMSRGRFNGGNKNPHSRLTENEASEIKMLKANGMTYSDIGGRYGLSKSHVENIVKNRVANYKNP